jgi:phosphoribosylformylglycinamidine (FGAM) synthase-like amidotransferase family enzyme
MKETVTTLIITGFGLNCEKETAKAFEMHGADTKLVHLNDLLAKNVKLEDFQILAFIGGFSFGDHLGAGEWVVLLLLPTARVDDTAGEERQDEQVVEGDGHATDTHRIHT